MGWLLWFLGNLEAALMLTGHKPISKYAPHPVIGPLLFGIAVAFFVHLWMEVMEAKREN